ncbi:MAG: FMN-binding negative transcriptional regulator [Geminicoccaceae bacterium]
MYQPAHFREDRLEVQHALIRAHPFGLLVTSGAVGLDVNPVPFLLDAEATPLGLLRAHVARANPVWRELADSPEVLVVFQAVDSYVMPSWYLSKREHGKVVPTWNYAVVQVRGKARAIEDAPAPFIASQVEAIVGIEIAIARIEGKWKASQNRPPADREGVVAGLEDQGDDASRAMAELVRERAQPSIGSSAANPSR